MRCTLALVLSVGACLSASAAALALAGDEPTERAIAVVAQAERPAQARKPGTDQPSAPALASATGPAEVRVYEIGNMPPAALEAIRPAVGLIDVVGPGLILVTAPADRQALVRAAIDQFASVRRDRVSVEVSLRRVTGPAPSVGAPAPQTLLDAPIVRYAQGSAWRGSAAQIATPEIFTYVRTTLPVVGSGAAAMQPSVAEERRGLDVSVRVGLTEDGASAVSVQGRYTDARLSIAETQSAQVTGTAVSVPGAAVQLLELSHRPFSSEVSVSDGATVVAAVFDDPSKAGSLLALTVRVGTPPTR